MTFSATRCGFSRAFAATTLRGAIGCAGTALVPLLLLTGP
jgi:hypothetical protein